MIEPAESSDGRIAVRPYRDEDVEPLFEAARESVAQVYPWLEWCHPDYSRDDSQAWVSSRAAAWRNGEDYAFAIADAGSGTFLGGCGLNQVNRTHGVANLGYWVRTSCGGRGIATAAARLVARFGFQKLGLNRIEILAAVGNRGSQRVAEKTGALREGTLRCRLMINGRSHDAVLYSLIPTDLKG